MGRVITNAPDADRSARVLEAAVRVLVFDPRVRAAEGLWRDVRNLPALLEAMHEAPTVAQAHALRDAILSAHPTDDALCRSLLEELGLTRLRWLTNVLVAQWRVWAVDDAAGDGYRWLAFRTRPLRPVDRAPGETVAAYEKRKRRLEKAAWPKPGRLAKDGPTHREDHGRNVEWWYRARVQVPPETPYSIAKAYAAARGISAGESYVRACIDRAETWLAHVTLEYD